MFVCVNPDCPNFDVIYYWEQPAPESVMCGGCGATLELQEVPA